VQLVLFQAQIDSLNRLVILAEFVKTGESS
jgi:hypothetical protein